MYPPTTRELSVVGDAGSDRESSHFWENSGCVTRRWLRDAVSPKLVIEILSPSTQLIDRREKLHNYRLIDSVQEYVIAAQNEHKLTIYRRADGWRPEVCAGAQGTAEFRSIGLVLPLKEIYDDIIGG